MIGRHPALGAVSIEQLLAGWTAHVYEQYSDNRLIRPESEYIGPLDVSYVPIADRS